MNRILVIEDDAHIRENLVWLLEAEGFGVCSASNGPEGIDLARRERPDLILCDIVMPGADGHEVLRTLRADAATAVIPFIFLTARAERDDVRDGMSGGADDYLTKPFSTGDVIAAVRARLKKQALLEQHQEARMDRLRVSISHALPHELRTPLVAIVGFSELLLAEAGETDPETTREMLQTIYDAGRRLERTVENYSCYAHLEMVATDPAAVATVRDGCTDGAADLVAACARAEAERYGRPADLVLHAEASAAAIREYLLRKAAEELVSNAFKFSEAGTPVVVRCGPRGGQFVLEVEDRGRGMQHDHLKHTGAFVQFDRPAFEQQGSGLGLAIVRRIAVLHGGTFTCDSTPGLGTRVCLALPVRG